MPTRWDWKIAVLQFVMQQDGYWGDVTGQYSKEFYDSLVEYAGGIKTVHTKQ
jgi:hypothetical protein